jgi:hypothetical protein
MSDHATPTGGDPIGRRGFLARGFWLVAGSIAGALALIGLAPTVAPAFRRNDERWISAGSAGLFMKANRPRYRWSGSNAMRSCPVSRVCQDTTRSERSDRTRP